MTVKQFKNQQQRSPLSHKWKQERSTSNTIDIGAFTIVGMTLFCIVMGTLKYGMDIHGW
ncbi:MAG: hypothetical protein GY941_22355 [Planctomycetes bacterium]|nr:hypothetical protein [Planctomycetota bacterium]